MKKIFPICAAIISIMFVSLACKTLQPGTFSMPTLTLASPTEAPVQSAPAIINGTQVGLSGIGDPNAPVKIIEYSDYQCPYCKKFQDETEQQLFDAYVRTGKVYFEYHSLGNFIGAESGRAVEAAYCAGDQQKFWPMHDIIFSNQGSENSGKFSDERLIVFASQIGLDSGKFSDCFTSGKYASKIEQDVVEAKASGVRATPSFVINGTLMEGAQPFSAFQAQIDPLLKK